MQPKREFMIEAIKEAEKARLRGDYAFGCAIVKDGKILVKGGNRVKTKNDSTRHVELEVIQYAKGMLLNRYLDDCILYSTAEPCFMCLGAIYWSGIKYVYYGIDQEDIYMYGKKFGNSTHRYRPSPIRSTELIERYNLPIVMKQFMRKECLDQIHNRCKYLLE